MITPSELKFFRIGAFWHSSTKLYRMDTTKAEAQDGCNATLCLYFLLPGESAKLYPFRYFFIEHFAESYIHETGVSISPMLKSATRALASILL